MDDSLALGYIVSLLCRKIVLDVSYISISITETRSKQRFYLPFNEFSCYKLNNIGSGFTSAIAESKFNIEINATNDTVYCNCWS